MIAADRAFFASQGGDVNIGGRLPKLFRRVGLDVTEIVPTLKTGRPGSEMWKWISDHYMGVLGQYAKFKPLDAKKTARLKRGWLKVSRSRLSVMIAPTVLDVVGKKRGR